MSLNLLLASCHGCRHRMAAHTQSRVMIPWTHDLKIAKKITVTSIKKKLQKLQKEVGMAMPKSTQTRVVDKITNTTGIPTSHIYAQFRDQPSQCPCGAAEYMWCRDACCICYHIYYPCLSTFWHCHPYLFCNFCNFFFYTCYCDFFGDFQIMGSRYHDSSLCMSCHSMSASMAAS